MTLKPNLRLSLQLRENLKLSSHIFEFVRRIMFFRSTISTRTALLLFQTLTLVLKLNNLCSSSTKDWRSHLGFARKVTDPALVRPSQSPWMLLVTWTILSLMARLRFQLIAYLGQNWSLTKQSLSFSSDQVLGSQTWRANQGERYEQRRRDRNPLQNPLLLKWTATTFTEKMLGSLCEKFVSKY